MGTCRCLTMSYILILEEILYGKDSMQFEIILIYVQPGRWYGVMYLQDHASTQYSYRISSV